MQHRISQVDVASRTAVCSVCGPCHVQVRETRADGTRRWRCNTKKREEGMPFKGGRALAYRLHKGDRCEACGFEPEHPCQLDVHHRDGNRQNNARGNLETLCANCHRLVTWIHRTDAWAVREWAERRHFS